MVSAVALVSICTGLITVPLTQAAEAPSCASRTLTWGSVGLTVGLFNMWVVVQNHVQQGGMNFQFPIVLDKAQSAEFIHKEAYARSRRADHFRQHLLTYLSHDRLRSPFFAEVRKKKEQPCEAPFA
jgi:hypothetical protein